MERVERDLRVLGVRRWRELVTDRKKMERYCETGQSPQRAVVPMEEKEASYPTPLFTFVLPILPHSTLHKFQDNGK